MDLVNVQDHNELLEQFSRSVVRIDVYRKFTDPAKPAEARWSLYLVIPGIVTMSDSNFCHIIACSRGFYPGQSTYAYVVTFPDETRVQLDMATVKIEEWLAAFYVRTRGKKVYAVQFNSENASEREKVQIFGYNHFGQSLLDGGSITHVGDEDFNHDCPASSLSCFGYPLFNLQNKLVGISYSDIGVTSALNVKQMTCLLSKVFEGMDGKPLPEIVERIRVFGEAKFRELQD